jgi:hypothetical protein
LSWAFPLLPNLRFFYNLCTSSSSHNPSPTLRRGRAVNRGKISAEMGHRIEEEMRQRRMSEERKRKRAVKVEQIINTGEIRKTDRQRSDLIVNH